MKIMKKFFLSICVGTFLISCNNVQKESETTNTQIETAIYDTDVKNKSFDDLFQNIDPTEIKDNVFKLVGQDYSVITAGTDSAYNSMTASYGGWGQLFEKPTTWCILNANRYTLEFIKQEKKYTMSYFPDQFKEQVIAFGSKSGRNSDKMKETQFTSVKTPNGNLSYKEAKLIIECKLVEITETNPNDFYTDESKGFIEKGIKDGNGKEYHKLVFGEITNVWIRK